MLQRAVAQGPLIPATYDVVWSAVTVLVLGLFVATIVMLVRLARRTRRRQQAPLAADPVEHVRQLADLREAGAITAAEYEARKDRILGPI